MNKNLGLLLLIIATIVFAKFAFFPTQKTQVSITEPTEIQEFKEEQEAAEDQDIPKSYVNVYFIGQNANKEEVYKVVKRAYNVETDGTKLNHSVKMLLKGPDATERFKGYYSEIPKGTKLLSLDLSKGKVIINLSNDFEQGGGTDSLYKRLYQLIKTVNKNTTLDVYLNINGKQADVIGGEGIMINQPLTSRSLED